MTRSQTFADLAVSAEGIVKRFGVFVALDNVSLDVKPHEVLGLVGQNGSGKSTLMKVLVGVYKPDVGKMHLFGKPYAPRDPRDAESHGISMVYQDGAPVPDLRAYQYIYLGRELAKRGMLDSETMKRNTQTLFEYLRIPCSPGDFLRDLQPANQRMVAIARASLGIIGSEGGRNQRIIILDEPTAQLSSSERSIVFEKVRDLKKQVSFIIISHLLQELLEISDRMTVIRDGRNVGTIDLHERSVSTAELHRLIMGREKQETIQRRESVGERRVIEVSLKRKGVLDISFSLSEGEIIGFYGTLGSGVKELGDALIGALKVDDGYVKKDGKPLRASVVERVREGIGYLTGVHEAQLNMNWTIQRNISLSNWDKTLIDFLKLPVIDSRKERRLAEKFIEMTDIRPPNPEAVCMILSGGNKQKVILARWLAKGPDVLVMDNPTAGVDVGTREEFYRLMAQNAASGKSFILISEDLDELITTCSRLHLMKDGKVVRTFESKELQTLEDEDVRQLLKDL